MKSALFLSPYRFFPAKQGLYKRTFDMLRGLRDLGWSVQLASPQLLWEESQEARDALIHLQQNYAVEFSGCARAASADKWQGRLSQLARLWNGEPPIETINRIYRYPWLTRLIHEYNPDLLFTSYVMSDHYVDHAQVKIPKVIDTIDLLTENQQLWSAVESLLPTGTTDASFLPDELFDTTLPEKKHIRPLDWELRIYDQYDCAVAIVQQEADFIAANTSHTKVTTIPVMQNVISMNNQYNGNAFLPIGANPFNIQGSLFFIHKSLPLIRKYAKDFCLHIAGSDTERIAPQPNILLTGFVDVKDVYYTAPFMLCPIFVGTGQQIKIIEAMAHGVPVIAMRFSAERSAVIHGENGLIADTAEELAEHTVRLWQDRKLCQKLGNAAREKVRSELSYDKMLPLLEATLQQTLKS